MKILFWLKNGFVGLLLLAFCLAPGVHAEPLSSKRQIQLNRWLASELNQGKLREIFKGALRSRLSDRDRFVFEKRMKRWKKPSGWQIESVGSQIYLSIESKPVLSLSLKQVDPLTIDVNGRQFFILKEGNVATSVRSFLQKSSAQSGIWKAWLPSAVAAHPSHNQALEDLFLFYSGGVVSAESRNMDLAKAYWQRLEPKAPWYQDVLDYMGKDSWVSQKLAEKVSCEPGRRVHGQATFEVPRKPKFLQAPDRLNRVQEPKRVTYEYEYQDGKLTVKTGEGTYHLKLASKTVGSRKDLNDLSPAAAEALYQLVPGHDLHKKLLEDPQVEIKGSMAKALDKWVGPLSKDEVKEYCEKTDLNQSPSQCDSLKEPSALFKACRMWRSQVEKRRKSKESEAVSPAEIHKGCLYDFPRTKQLIQLDQFVKYNLPLENMPAVYQLESGTCPGRGSCFSQLQGLWEDLALPKELHAKAVAAQTLPREKNWRGRELVRLRQEVSAQAEAQFMRQIVVLDELKKRCDDPELRKELWKQRGVLINPSGKETTQ